jgi:hypothetical protein
MVLSRLAKAAGKRGIAVHRGRLALIVTSALAVLAVSQPPARAANNTLYDNWWGQPGWTGDTGFVSPVPGQHSESSTVEVGQSLLMYHRINVGSTTGIGLSISADGNNWTTHGAVLMPAAVDAAVSPHIVRISAPSVWFDPASNPPYSLVYEAWPPTLAGSCWASPREYIGMSNSVDGINWTNHRIVIRARQPWDGLQNGSYCGDTGTPNIVRDRGGRYWITYHGFNGVQPFQLRPGAAYLNTATPTQITESTLVRSASPMTFLTQTGTTSIYSILQYNVGIGARDITTLDPTAGGTDDGGYYMVLEAFQDSPNCDTVNKTMISIARAPSIGGPWRVQDKVLFGQQQGCWRDMPSWQYHELHYKVVMTKRNTANGGMFERRQLTNTYVPSTLFGP